MPRSLVTAGVEAPCAIGLPDWRFRLFARALLPLRQGSLGLEGDPLSFGTKSESTWGVGRPSRLMKKAITRMQSRAHLGSGGWSGDDVDEL